MGQAERGTSVTQVSTNVLAKTYRCSEDRTGAGPQLVSSSEDGHTPRLRDKAPTSPAIRPLESTPQTSPTCYSAAYTPRASTGQRGQRPCLTRDMALVLRLFALVLQQRAVLRGEGVHRLLLVLGVRLGLRVELRPRRSSARRRRRRSGTRRRRAASVKRSGPCRQRSHICTRAARHAPRPRLGPRRWPPGWGLVRWRRSEPWTASWAWGRQG
jgi:hypothetical protein